MNPEIRDAKNIYWWLWLSPLALFITFPIVLGMAVLFLLRSWSEAGYGFFMLLLGLPHIWLLIPALIAKRDFVRWHARQALLFAGIQSLVLPVFMFFDNNKFDLVPVALLVGPLIWIGTNIWGGTEAARGQCTLMRWAGRGARLPLLSTIEADSADPQRPAPALNGADSLVNLIRFSRDADVRRNALDELKKLGLVEEL